MTFNENISKEDAAWILDSVIPKAGYRINAETLGWWRDAHNKMFDEQVGIPGCSCHYVQTMKLWQSRVTQYQSQLEQIRTAPVTITTNASRKTKKG